MDGDEVKSKITLSKVKKKKTEIDIFIGIYILNKHYIQFTFIVFNKNKTKIILLFSNIVQRNT